MKDKNLPLDYDSRTLEELTDEANQIIKSLEEKDDLNNSVESYQDLLKLNNLIEKKFQKNSKHLCYSVASYTEHWHLRSSNEKSI